MKQSSGFFGILCCLILILLIVSTAYAEPEKAGSNPGIQPDQINIMIDPDLLWNEETGIFAEGPEIEKGSVLPYRNAVYRKMMDTPQPGEIQYFSGETGEIIFAGRMEMSLEGRLSLDMPQKSIRIQAADTPFQAVLFPERTDSVFRSFLLYNGGMDCLMTRLADVVQTQLVEEYLDADVMTFAWRPVTVNINGVYWGQYFLRESFDVDTICRRENLPEEQAEGIILFRYGKCESQNESARELNTIIQAYADHPDAENTERIEAIVDMDSFIDWLAVKIFFGDPDPSTLACYKIPGRKLRFVLTDMDYGLFRADANPLSYYRDDHIPVAQTEKVLFQLVTTTDGYREKFIRRLGEIYQTLTIERMQKTLSECVAAIESEMPAHFDRWAPEKDTSLYIEVPTEPDEALKYWRRRIIRMWGGTMVNRPARLYSEIQQYFQLGDDDMLKYFGVAYQSWLYTDQ